jgi:hypothetical protein
MVGDLRVAMQMPPPADDFRPDFLHEVVEGCDAFLPPELAPACEIQHRPI